MVSVICLFALPALAQTQQEFARAVGTAVTAELYCNMPGEAKRMLAFVNEFRSGFSPWNNKEDASLVALYSVYADKGAEQIGAHAWCIQYRAIMSLRD